MNRPDGLHRGPAPGQERSVTVDVKSLRNPPLDIKLSSQSLNTSILDVKNAVSSQTSLPTNKMKLLYKKKPIPDSKVLKDLLDQGETAIEFSVMVLGGASAAEAPTAAGTSGAAVVAAPAFWDDLRGFLLQRVNDEKEADRLYKLFRSSWETGR